MTNIHELRKAFTTEAGQLVGVAQSLDRQREAFIRAQEHLCDAMEGSCRHYGKAEVLHALALAQAAIEQAQTQAKRANVVLNLMAASL